MSGGPAFDPKTGIIYINGHAFPLTEDEQWALAVDLSRALIVRCTAARRAYPPQDPPDEPEADP